ncbi:ABC transporter permease [Streptomyces smyrnaeus]|uniref:ABC transporter permease n=1 Tax=Streptomyces TaxID=1883 RepID=UPI000C181A0A|nr:MULTISPECIES: anibiotic ABC transporter [unclassified Streptomyces]MBQ0866086.1 anibiotic ABC transporter [Streptomyces sp. RK75]MBQ1123581.1 anibiotic ABC transporter [Streptomyces sp. B15]MBQ1158335.1 anibiotic ABC transporter [Streptomyces sp. A73]
MRALTGTGVLTRLALRRDRLRLPLWVVGLAALFASIGNSISGLYETDAARLENAQVRADNVVTRAFTGPAPGSSTGALTVSEGLVFTCVLVALMNILLVVRHTRQNEELGRTELVGSAAVGRHAQLTAALLVGGLANVLLIVLSTLALIGMGLPAGGSALAGLALGTVGLAFAGLTAVAAQLTESARAATGLGGLVLATTFLLRAAGDAFGNTASDDITVNPAWPSWISPLGWGQQLRPYGESRVWPLALLLLCCALSVLLAVRLSVHRDVGTGMLPARRGAVRASSAMLKPIGLVWRLQRGLVLGWMVGIAVFGAVFGGIGDQVDDLFSSEKSAQFVRDLGGEGDLVNAYFAGMMGLLAVVVSGFTVQALIRLRSDEENGPTEAVLATSVSRAHWLLAHTLIALLGTALVLAVLGLSTGLAYGAVSNDLTAALGDLMETTLAQLAPTAVLAGFALAAFGLLPRLAATVTWAAFAVCLVIGQFGTLLNLPDGLLDISPYSHLPNMPAESLTVMPIVVMVVLAGALTVVGVAGFRRRSLALGG